MSIFKKGKKTEKTSECCCDSNCCNGGEPSLDNAKKTENTSECCCDGNCCNGREPSLDHTKKDDLKVGLSVKVLGSGCANCNRLEAATKEALELLGLEVVIEHVTDFSKIAAYGVMSTPALVINEKVVSYGKVLKTEEVVQILKKVAL